MSQQRQQERRAKRLQAARHLLTGITTAVTDDGLDIIVSKPRTETSELSSQLFQPRLQRLVRVVAQRLSRWCEESKQSSAVTESLRSVFTHADAGGGGSEEDIAQSLFRCVEAMELSDAEIGFTLLSAYQFLQAQDLPFCSLTWRPMLVTAVLVAMECICDRSKESERAAERIQRQIAHWWPRCKADQGRVAFINREVFKKASRSEIAKLYFEVRDTGLRKDLSDEVDSNASVVAVFLAELASQPPAASTSRSTWTRAAPDSTLDEDSLKFSDNGSLSFDRSEKLLDSEPSGLGQRCKHIVTL